MDEEILEALTKANAVDQESGLTIGRLMEITGKDRDMVVGRIRSLKRDQKVRVSNESHLADDGRHARPTGFALEIPSSAMTIARNEHKDLIHPPIIVWLGPELQERLEAKRIEKEKNELMKSLLERPQSIGNQFNGPATNVITGPVDQRLSLNDQSTQTTIAQPTITHHPASLSSGHDIRNTVIGGVILLVIGWLVKWYWTGDPF